MKTTKFFKCFICNLHFWYWKKFLIVDSSMKQGSFAINFLLKLTFYNFRTSQKLFSSQKRYYFSPWHQIFIFHRKVSNFHVLKKLEYFVKWDESKSENIIKIYVAIHKTHTAHNEAYTHADLCIYCYFRFYDKIFAWKEFVTHH